MSKERILKEQIKKTRNFLIIATGITILAICVNIYLEINNYHQVRSSITNVVKLTELREKIIYYDEVLTMSTNMAVQTGNAKWRVRYKEYEQKLINAIDEATKSLPQGLGHPSLVKVSKANDALIKFEETCFQLLESGRLKEAQAILNGADYQNNKILYSDAMDELYKELRLLGKSLVEAESSTITTGILIEVLFLILFIFLWSFIARLVQRLNASVQKDQYMKLEQAHLAQKSFLSTMSHELRTPLNAIIGYSELILENLASEDYSRKELEEDVDCIHYSGQHLIEMIADILDLAKIEAGELTLNHVTFNIAEQIQHVVEISSVLAQKGNNLLETKIQPNIGIMTGDHIRFRQILLNIIGNSAKFTKNGTITIRVNGDDQHVVIQISDTGIGIPPEDLKRVFEAFKQVNLKGKEKGTGIGLSITQKLCHMMGASIHLESQLEVGTTFRLTFPREMTNQLEGLNFKKLP